MASSPGGKSPSPPTSPGAGLPRHPPPRKEVIQGSYQFVQYRPVWTDPEWQDHDPEREKTVFKVLDPVFDRLRPALLPRDAFSNPTIYAQRFSIFPGRTDGRSRTSPTRSDRRQLFPANAQVKTGKQLFDRFEELAKDAGQHVDDYMEQARPDMKSLTETEQQYMQQYEDLLIDEHWQNILFGSLTMDEILAEGYFTMCDTEFNELSGPLYHLFARERWEDGRTRGGDEKNPRYLYNLNGRREEWDPRNNDRVWNALQPALQLTTRLLLMEEDFIEGLQDITNRYWVDDKLFANLPDQKRTKKLKFKRDVDSWGPRKVNGAQRLKDSGVDVKDLSWKALCQVFKIRLASGFDMDGKPSRHHTMGQAMCPSFFTHDTQVTIDIDAELVWPLLVDKYTKSEKLLANIILATTLTHEMMHAFTTAPFKWLGDPASFGITDPEQVAACQVLHRELIDPKFKDRWHEPYFEDDHVGEVGHAYEEHVLAGGYWPFVFATTTGNRPPLLQTAGGLMALMLNSEGEFNVVPNLDEPRVQFTMLKHLVRFEDVKKYFSQSFWDVAIEKYGSAALREPSKKPHKFNFYPADQDYDGLIITQLNISKADEEWLLKFRSLLIRKKSYILWNYLHSIMAETAQYDAMTNRLDHAVTRWLDDGAWAKPGREAHMILCEFLAHFAQTHLPKVEAGSLRSLHWAWNNTRRVLGSCADWESQQLYQNTATRSDREQRWAQNLQSGAIDRFEGRLIPRLIDFAVAVERELGHHESLLCELYQGGIGLCQLWLANEPGDINRWRTYVGDMQTILKDLEAAMQLVPEGARRLEGDWEQRILTLGRRTKDLVRLLDLDPSKHDWRELMWTLPMLRKSRRLPHQRYYFLAKKEMLKATGNDLQLLQEFKRRFQKHLSLGGYKLPLPDTDPDELSIAQRLSGTLDDDRGDNPRDQQIRGPSTGIFDVEAVRNLVEKLRQEDKEAQEVNVNRIAENQRDKTDVRALKGDATMQAGGMPQIQPKFQQMGMNNQPTPFSNFRPFDGSNGPFSAYSSLGTGSSFPSPQPNQPSPWLANSAVEMAAWANEPLGGVPAAAHGIMPHPYAVRSTVTEDLQHTSTSSLPTKDPSTFDNQYPRESAVVPETSLGTGPLGDLDQQLNQNSDSDVEMADASTGGHAGRVGVVSDFGHSSSDTEVSDYGELQTSDSSDTTLVWSSGDEGASATGSDEFPASKKGGSPQKLKRKSSWAPVTAKKQRIKPSEAETRRSKVEQKKGIEYKKRKGGSLAWRKILSGLSGAF